MGQADVRLRIYCGLPDPRWSLDSPADQNYVRRWLAAAWASGRDAPRAGRGPVTAADLPTTGYRGFEVTIDGRRHLVYRDALVTSRPGAEAGKETIDQFLFRTNAVNLQKDFGFDESILEVATRRPIEGLDPTCATTERRFGNVNYHPSAWVPKPYNSDTCYGYAADVRTQNAVLPANSEQPSWTREELIAALRDDGLGASGDSVPNDPPADPAAHYVVALLNPDVGDRGDFHFMRLDHNGCWSQKVSTDPVTNHDDSIPAKRITDLCAARFAARFVLVGFFECNEAVRLRLIARGGAR